MKKLICIVTLILSTPLAFATEALDCSSAEIVEVELEGNSFLVLQAKGGLDASPKFLLLDAREKATCYARLSCEMGINLSDFCEEKSFETRQGERTYRASWGTHAAPQRSQERATSRPTVNRRSGVKSGRVQRYYGNGEAGN